MYKYNPATQVTVGVATPFDLVGKTHGLWDRSVDVLGAEENKHGRVPLKIKVSLTQSQNTTYLRSLF